MKAISPIIATLLLIAIAVVASLVVYAWVMGYIGYQTSNAGNSVVIQSVPMPADKVTTIYLQNTGTTPVTVNPFAFVNGVEYPATFGSTGTGTGTLTGGNTLQLNVNSTSLIPVNPLGVSVLSGSMVTIKVTTTGGTYSQVSQQAP